MSPDEFRKSNLTDNVPKMYDCNSNITEPNHLIFLWGKKKNHSVVEAKRQKCSRETRSEPSS